MINCFVFLFRGDDSDSDEEKDPDKKKFENSLSGENTPDRRQLKTVLTIDEIGSKWLETVLNYKQSKPLFLTIFDLRSQIVLTFSIAAYPV